jgi:hypothetical protein
MTYPLTAHRLHIELAAGDPITLHAHNGSALRGMLFRALVHLTENPPRDAHSRLQFTPSDPMVRYLLATLNEESPRGQNPPRPLTVEPWCDLPQRNGRSDRHDYRDHTIPPGGRIHFSVTLFAHALEAFPYLIMALQRAGEYGMGRRDEDGWRGRFALARVWCENPFTAQTQDVFFADDDLVRMPDLPITHEHIMAQPMPAGHTLKIKFLTPATLTHRNADGQRETLRVPHFNVLFHRIIERVAELDRLANEPLVQIEGATPNPLPCLPQTRDERNALLRLADAVQLVHDDTHWINLKGRSDRTRAATNLAGFLGLAIYEAEDWSPFLPLLRWAEVTHAGKSAVKGNGWLHLPPLAPGRIPAGDEFTST